MNIDVLVAQGEAMHEELGREHYLTGSGRKSNPEFWTIYEKYAALQQDEALAIARDSGSLELFEWIVDVRVGQLVAPLEERQLVWEQRARLDVDGCTVPYLRAAIDLANTADRSVRRALDAERARAGAEGLNALLRERFLLEHDTIARLDLGDYVEALSALSGIDMEALGQAAQTFLVETRDVYADGLGRFVKQRLGLNLPDLIRADGPWLFRADRFDAAFPSDQLIETATAQMREMGLDAEVGGRITFDTEEREGKQPRAFCVPVRVPYEVYLVLRPRGGHSDYRTFWHELGHAMHFALVAPELPFAARWLGDNSVTEAFAMLWDHLTVDCGWLTRYTDLGESGAKDLLFELAVGELFMLRRYAAKLCYELELHRSDLTDMARHYVRHLTDATHFRHLENDHLLDLDPGFYAARYLRAWQLEAALSDALVERFDEDWYRNPKAGGFVQELMSRGQAEAADRLAWGVTGGELGFDPVVSRIATALA